MLDRLRVVEKRQQFHRLKKTKVLTNPSRFKGDERRFVGNITFEKDLFGRKIIMARHMRFRQLFHYIQARGITCCLHVASDNLRARATLITLNGRGICCVFRRRGHKQQTTGEGALNELLMVLKEVDCTFNLSLLNNATAHGMAAMFYGESIVKSMRAPRRTFLMALDELKQSGGAGCVQVFNAQDEMVVTAYVHKGEARSFVTRGGFLESTNSAGRLLSDKLEDHRCMAFRLLEVDKLDENSFPITNIRVVDEQIYHDGIKFESTEDFLTPFFKKPNLRDTFLYDNISSKEQQAIAIEIVCGAAARRTVENYSHRINPFFGKM